MFEHIIKNMSRLHCVCVAWMKHSVYDILSNSLCSYTRRYEVILMQIRKLELSPFVISVFRNLSSIPAGVSTGHRGRIARGCIFVVDLKPWSIVCIFMFILARGDRELCINAWLRELSAVWRACPSNSSLLPYVTSVFMHWFSSFTFGRRHEELSAS